MRDQPWCCRHAFSDVANLSVSVSKAHEPRLIFLDMHFPTLLTFRLQRPHIALQTFRFQRILCAHVTLLPPSSDPNAISVPMPQGYTNMDTGNLDTWRGNHEATIAPGAGRSEKLHINTSICKMIPQAFWIVLNNLRSCWKAPQENQLHQFQIVSMLYM